MVCGCAVPFVLRENDLKEAKKNTQFKSVSAIP